MVTEAQFMYISRLPISLNQVQAEQGAAAGGVAGNSEVEAGAASAGASTDHGADHGEGLALVVGQRSLARTRRHDSHHRRLCSCTFGRA